MHLRIFTLAAAAAVAIVVGATTGCLGNGVTNSVAAADTVCERGALKVGDSIAHLFDGANGCRIVDLYSAETTFANSYTLSLTSGSGYLITMGTTDSNPYLRPALELVNSAKHLIAYDTYFWRAEAALTFVADSTTNNLTVRAATLDTLGGDFGYYFIKMQQCSVPAARLVLSTDAVTHADSITSTDCKMPISDFNQFDSSRVQLYSMHMDSGQARTLTYSANAPMVILVGPTYDTFASLRGSFGVDSSGSQSGSLEFGADSIGGNYTIVVGPYSYPTTSVSYSLAISAEHAPTMQRMLPRQRAAHETLPMAGSTRPRPRCCSVR